MTHYKYEVSEEGIEVTKPNGRAVFFDCIELDEAINMGLDSAMLRKWRRFKNGI